MPRRLLPRFPSVPLAVRALSFVLLAAALGASPTMAQTPARRASPAAARPSAAPPAAPAIQPSSASSIFADPAARADAEAALAAANDLRFGEIEPHARALDARFPGHPAVPFLRAQPTWWRILLDLSSNAYDGTFNQQMDEVVRLANARLRRNRNDFDARFFRGVALGYKARMNVNRSRWWPAAREGKEAFDDVLFVARRNVGNPDFGFGRGLYDYYAEVMRERYPVARPILTFFPDGDRARGLAALRAAAENGTFTRSEATYFLAQILYLYEGNPTEALTYVRQLRARHPGNPYFNAFEGRLLLSTGQYGAAKAVFEALVARYDAGQTAYVGLAEQSLFQLARVAMAQGRAEDALAPLDRVETITARFQGGESYYRVLGRLRRGMALDALGRRDEALAAYQQVLAMRDLSDSHATARQYLDRPYGG